MIYAIVSSKTIAGQTYSVQMHELFFYPQRAGEFEIPPFKVRFGVAGKPGEDAIEYSEQTKALKIAAKMPPGAEHLSVLISATDLKVTESWNPQPADKITVGDAFKRSITFRAPDMPGMAMGPADHAYGDGSGTSRNPGNDGAMKGLHLATGDWMVMLHGYATSVYTNQGGPSGDQETFVESMAMLTGTRDFGGVRLQLRSMMSLEPAMGAKGYPNLFATGETANGTRN